MKYNLINENFQTDYTINLLKSRGIVDIEEYINPSPANLQSPADLKSIGLAAALYLRIVLKNRPRILIVVDSDNDGFTSAAIIYQYTHQVNCHAQIDYILHEGKQHGLADHIEMLMQKGEQYDLIILPDSSSNDVHYHNMLEEIHLPCLILDHHLTDVELSDNAIIVNNQLSPNYRNKDLTGAGVVYQFCRYIDAKLNQNWADNYIDLAAWGIIGDMGSMLDLENRFIVKYGLSHIQNAFFKCLLEKAGYSITGQSSPSWDTIVENTNPISVAFYVVPMVNALIRVGTMEEKNMMFQAFIDGGALVPCKKRGAKGTFERADIETARVCANAKDHQKKMIDEIMTYASKKIEDHHLLDNKILFFRLDEETFPSELNGYLAMKLVTKYKKPTIVARRDIDGFDKGSMRGMNQSALSDFKTFLMESGYFEWCQGHANAAGACINDDNLEAFHAYANQKLADIDFGENVYDVNFVRNAYDDDIRDLIFDLCSYKGIWGQNNPEALVCIRDLRISSDDIKIMGKLKDTLKIEYNGISYIKFFASKDMIPDVLACGDTINLNLVCKPAINNYMGRLYPQMQIEGYEVCGSNIYEF